MGLRDRLRSVAGEAVQTAKDAAVDAMTGGSSSRSDVGSVAPDWWGTPTLAAGDGALSVVGESHYQAALEAVAQGRTVDGCRVSRVMAQLVREPRNVHDRNAVRVDVGGRPVGYVPREIAPRLHHVLDHLTAHGFPATCRAELTGGWSRGWHDEGSIGCELHVADPLTVFDPSRHGALPEGTRVSVVREEHYSRHIATLLADTSEAEGAARLLQVDADPHARSATRTIEVRAGGGVVGYLTPAMSSRYLPLLAFAEARGLPLTSRMRLQRGAAKVEAFVRLPRDPSPYLVG